MVATEALVASCHSCSLTPNRRAQEASNVRDSLRLAVIAANFASIVVSAAPIASPPLNRTGEKNGEFFLEFFVEDDLDLIPNCHTRPLAGMIAGVR
jgi:hypothetical protein